MLVVDLLPEYMLVSIERSALLGNTPQGGTQQQSLLPRQQRTRDVSRSVLLQSSARRTDSRVGRSFSLYDDRRTFLASHFGTVSHPDRPASKVSFRELHTFMRQ